MDNQDYEKAKQECWAKYATVFDLRGSMPNEAFNHVFSQAYHLGMEAAKKEQQNEPKYHVGEKVSVHYPTGSRIGFIKEVMLDGSYDIDFGGGCTGHGISEYLLEPYTEPQADRLFDNIVKRGFQNHNRLNIAAMIMASIMGNAKWGDKYSQMAQMAFAATDALLEEAEKGGSK